MSYSSPKLPAGATRDAIDDGDSWILDKDGQIIGVSTRGGRDFLIATHADDETAVLAKANLTGGNTISIGLNTGLPVPCRNGKVGALLGDSITWNNNSDGAAFTAKWNSQLGYFSWANFRAKKRFVSPPELNFGVFGERTDQVLLRVSQVISAAPDFCVVLAGTNDVSGDVSAATIISNLRLIWTALTNAGIVVIAGTLFPRSDAGMTANRAKVLAQVNQQIRALAPTLKNVFVWDGYSALADPTSLICGCVAAYFADNLHPNRTGAFWVSKPLAAVLDAVFPAVAIPRYQCVSGGDLYDATYAPQGNLFTNAMLSGTAGTKVAGVATGSVADGFSVYRAQGSTIQCVASKGAMTLDNGQTYATQILTVSSPGGGAALEEFTFYQNPTTAVGDNVLCGADIDIAAVSGRLNYVTARTQAQYGAYPQLGHDLLYPAGGAASIPAAISGHTCSNPGLTPSGGTVTQGAIAISLDCTVASSVQVTIALPYFRKI